MSATNMDERQLDRVADLYTQAVLIDYTTRKLKLRRDERRLAERMALGVTQRA